MEDIILKKLRGGEVRCARCGLIIPLTFKKGKEFTCPSFTMIDELPVCYRDYRKEVSPD